jgi:bifunctional hydroxylase/dehydrase
MRSEFDVVIAGAGPAGLMLAAELELGGVHALVVERMDRRTGQSRALGFTARTMEIFDQRGLLPRLGDIETSPVGHFGGIPVDFSLVEGGHFGGKNIPQSQTEDMLEQWAIQLGADIRYSAELLGFHADADGVEVEVQMPTGQHRFRASYLVGCDGGRSTVRKLGGFDFPGTPATMEMFIADVRGCELKPRMIGETYPNGMVMVGPLGDGVDRIVVCERGKPPRKRELPPSFEEVADGWQRITGQNIQHGEPLWVTSFGDATRQVTEYRRGRVLLAGDAAHIHLPAGGQGMNVSLQDATNLGWKLAAELRGDAPPELLDTYHAERHPVGQKLLVNTQAQGLLFLTGSEMEPLREVMRQLISNDSVGRHLAGMVSGLDIRYEVGDVHPLAGMRLPKRTMSTPTGSLTSTEPLHRGHGALLDFTATGAFARVAQSWPERVETIHATRPEGTAYDGIDAALVRPDGYVAWVAPSDLELTSALRRWFGEPVAAVGRMAS